MYSGFRFKGRWVRPFGGRPNNKRRVKRIQWIALLAAVVVSSSAWADTSVKPIAWSMLIDPGVQAFDDPFKKLSPVQLSQLAIVARERERLKTTSDLIKEEREWATERISSAEQALNADGIDIDGLIAMRWIIAERRQRAASAGNEKLDGASVRISGFLIPVGSDEQGAQIAYLVPERGMCSHTPPPPPNQLVRVRMTADWTPTRYYEAVRLTGKLALASSSKKVRIIDGMVWMIATYQLEAREVETVAVRPPATWRSKSIQTNKAIHRPSLDAQSAQDGNWSGGKEQ
jgi:hypothetical protein